MGQYSTLAQALSAQILKKGLSNAAVGRKLGGISGQRIGQYRNGDRLPKADFYIKWKRTFNEDLASMIKTEEGEQPTESNVSPETTTSTHTSTPATRAEEILERHNAFLQRLLETNLNKLSEVQYMVLAQVQAGQKWEAKNISKGNVKKYLEALAELSTLAGESLNAFGIMDINVPVSREGKSVP